MHRRCWMKAVPKDVIVRVVLHKEGTIGRLVGELTAVRKAKPGRLISHRHENRVNIHKVDPDLEAGLVHHCNFACQQEPGFWRRILFRGCSPVPTMR
jgi:hypothetical protein